MKMTWQFLAVALVGTLWAVQLYVTSADDFCSGYAYPGANDVDIRIAAVLGIHESDGDKCSSNYSTGALQNAIALNWAAQLVNGNNITESFIPGVRIGIEVYDDCHTQYLAASHAGTLTSHTRDIKGCFGDSTVSSSNAPLAGVIGTSFSHTTTTLARILEPTYLPIVGPSATVSELSDKQKFPNFVRVVPSDLKQAKVMIKLAKYFSWSYIVGISTSDNYGAKGMAELRRLALKEMICVSLIPNFDLFNVSEMERFVRTTLVKKFEDTADNLGIVYFGLYTPLIRFLKFVEQKRSSWNNEDNKLLTKIYWVASDAVETSQELSNTISQYRNNILVVSPFLVDVSSFKDYFIDFLKHPPAWISGPWESAIKNVVQNNFRCSNYNMTEESMASCKIDDYLVIDAYIPSVLDAFYLLANTLKSIQLKDCNQEVGVCSAFLSTLTNGLLKKYNLLDLNCSNINPAHLPVEFAKTQRRLQNISGDFEVIDQPLYSLQAIKGNNFVKAAEFKGETLTMSPEFARVFSSSTCKATCQECLNLENISYIYHPGDVIFLGIFSIHWQSNTNPFMCGVYRENSYSYIAMEAFINAVYYLNNSTGISFGYLILDDCYNPLILTRLLNGVLSGDITVKSSGGKAFDTSKVAVVIGAQSSHVTMAALPILTELNITMISYSASNTNLDNRIMYPFFSRTVNSDTVQARAFVDILKAYKVTYVGAIVIQNIYGLELYKLFRSIAESERICVDDAYEVTEHTTEDIYGSFLRDFKFKKIQVIVLIAMDKLLSTFFKAVKTEDEFVFIGSDAWGPNLDIIRNENGKKVRGALVLGAATVPLNFGFRNHLQTLDPFNTSSVWLWDFWQDQFQCDMPGGFSNTHGGITCDSTTSSNLNTILDDLVSSPLAVHATMATVSAGLTVSTFLTNKKQMPFNPTEFTNAVLSVKLPSSTAEIRPFLDSGNGDFGFEIYNVQPSTNNKDKIVYVNVGSYRRNTGLSLNKSLVKFYDAAGQIMNMEESSCLEAGQQCRMVCIGSQTSSPGIGSVTPRVADHLGGESEAASRDTTVVVLAVLLALFMLFVVILVVLGCLVYTGRIHRKDTNGAVYNTMSSDVALPRIRASSIESPHGSNSSDFRPQLPTRTTADSNHVYTSSSISDMVSPSHRVIPVRLRTNSMPAISGPNIQFTRPETFHAPKRHLPLGHTGMQGSTSQFQRMDVSDQLEPGHKELPVTFSSVAGSNSHNLEYFANENVGNYDPYNGMYRNADNQMNNSPTYSQKGIIFQNGPHYDAIYTLASPIDNLQPALVNANHPKSGYIYLQTPEGIVHIPSQDFEVFLNSNGAYFQNQPNTGRSGLGNIDSVDIASSPLADSTHPIDYVTPIDVMYDSTSRAPGIPAGFKLTSENVSKKMYIEDPAAAALSQTGMISSASATNYPPSNFGSNYTVDSSNYVSRHYGLIKPTNENQNNFKTQSEILSPSKLDTSPHNKFSMQQQGVELKDLLKPGSLPVVPVYQSDKQEAPHLQDLSNSSEGLNIEHLPPWNSPTDGFRNVTSISEAQVENYNTPGTSQEENMRRQRGQNSPSRVVLSLLKEEPEEMV